MGEVPEGVIEQAGVLAEELARRLVHINQTNAQEQQRSRKHLSRRDLWKITTLMFRDVMGTPGGVYMVMYMHMYIYFYVCIYIHIYIRGGHPKVS